MTTTQQQPALPPNTEPSHSANAANLYAILGAMTARERYAFELAVEYRCKQMARTLWRRAARRVDE